MRAPVNRLGGVVALVGCLIATGVLASELNRAYPIKDWLFWRYATLWAWEALLMLGCLAAGSCLLGRLFDVTDAPVAEHLALSSALGVSAFVLLMTVVGLLGYLGAASAILLPVAGILAGRRDLKRALRWVSTERFTYRLGMVQSVGFAIGVVAMGLIYFQILTPDSLNYDSVWFHVTAGQDYAREGRIRAFPADWAKSTAGVTAILSSWAFQVPGLERTQRWILVLHTEFALFVWTLVGITAAVEHNLGRSSPHAFLAYFLFPGIFVYDMNLGGGGDHITAFFMAPLVIATIRACTTKNPKWWGISGVLSGTAFLSKAQSSYVIGTVLAVLAIVWLFALFSKRGGQSVRRASLSSAYFAAGAVTMLSPQCTKNWLAHHNPLYPLLLRWFPGSTPAMPGSAAFFDRLFVPFEPGSLPLRLRRGAELLFSYSFQPNLGHGGRPLLGSLFSLLLPFSILVGRSRAFWLSVLFSVAAILGWSVSFISSRNLEIITPLLVIVTATIIGELFARSRLVRPALVGLVGLQVVWNLDAPAIDAGDRLKSSLSLLRSGIENDAAARFSAFRKPFVDVGQALPADAVVVLHTAHDQLGIDRTILLDWLGFQGLIDYRGMRTARDVYDRFHELHVTHIITQDITPARTRQEEAVFNTFLYRYARQGDTYGGMRLWRMPPTPPPKEASYRVLLVRIASYPNGIYPVERLAVIEDHPDPVRWPEADTPLGDSSSLADATVDVDVVLIHEPTWKERQTLTSQFLLTTTIRELYVYVRREPRAPLSGRAGALRDSASVGPGRASHRVAMLQDH